MRPEETDEPDYVEGEQRITLYIYPMHARACTHLESILKSNYGLMPASMWIILIFSWDFDVSMFFRGLFL